MDSPRQISAQNFNVEQKWWWCHLGPNLSSNSVDLRMFKICPKVQKSFWFDGAQLLMVSDLLLGTVISDILWNFWLEELDLVIRYIYARWRKDWQSRKLKKLFACIRLSNKKYIIRSLSWFPTLIILEQKVTPLMSLTLQGWWNIYGRPDWSGQSFGQNDR